jgi:hypothetical protein
MHDAQQIGFDRSVYDDVGLLIPEFAKHPLHDILRLILILNDAEGVMGHWNIPLFEEGFELFVIACSDRVVTHKINSKWHTKIDKSVIRQMKTKKP